MGYDMSLEQIPPGAEEGIAAHNSHMNRIRAVGMGSEEATKLWKDLPPNPIYFRLNIFGMSKYIRFMQQFGMLATNYPPIDWKHFTDDLVEAPLGGEEPGIPIDKLGTNDHWLVRPEECASALKAYEQFTQAEVLRVVGEDNLDYWEKWINFLRTASENGGFRVD